MSERINEWKDKIMEKKLYMSPLMEVEQINLTGMLMESPVTNPIPPVGPAGIAPRKRRTPVF